jgi:glycosyltransferase involved in cell wall biosynthesis
LPDSTTILQASAHETGGAGTVMLSLHVEYLRRGLDSWVAVGHSLRPDPRVLQIPNREMRSSWSRVLGRVDKSAARRSTVTGSAARALLTIADPERFKPVLSGGEDFSFPGTRALLALTPRRPNVLHLHNLHGDYFDLRLLPGFSRQVPVVLTMHDAWLLTGHCAHPFGCRRWETGCGECPDLDMYVPIRKDASASNWRLKRGILARSRAVLVSPSRWLLDMLEQTLPLGDQLGARLIPNGVDVTVFRPGDKEEARRLLRLPQGVQLLLATAEMLARNPFKDFSTLRAALSRIAPRLAGPVALVALGLDQQAEGIEGVEVIGVPFTADSDLVARYYQAADIYVHAARAENLPLTIIEAMACGTPVVASDVGGVGELVVDGVTGLLMPSGDSEVLANVLTVLLEDSDRREAFGRAGSERVLTHFTLEKQADAYLDLYAELRGTWSSDI